MKALLSLTVLAFVLVSCQKEVGSSVANQTTDSLLVPTNARLVAMYFRDSTLPAGQDTVGVRRFTYDAQGRAITIADVSYDPYYDSTSMRLEYNGSDTLASRTISYERSDIPGMPPTITYDTTWRQYTNGMLNYDSTSTRNGTTDGYTVNRYVYSGSMVFHYVYGSNSFGVFPTPPLPTDTAIRGMRYTVTRSNGDIIAQTDDSATYNPRTGAIRFISNVGSLTAQYDSRPNPLFAVGRSIQSPFLVIEYFRDVIEDGNISHRLMTASSHTNPVYAPNGRADISNSYQFNANGLPVKARLTENYGTSSITDQAIYKYQ